MDDKTYSLRSAQLLITSGRCDLCGENSMGTLDFGSEEETFFCSSCGRLEWEETLAKSSEGGAKPPDRMV